MEYITDKDIKALINFRKEITKLQTEVKKVSKTIDKEIKKIKDSFNSLNKSISNLRIDKVFSNISTEVGKLESEIQKIKKTMAKSSDMYLKSSGPIIIMEIKPELLKPDISGMLDLTKAPMEEMQKSESDIKEFMEQFGEIKSTISESVGYFSYLKDEISKEIAKLQTEIKKIALAIDREIKKIKDSLNSLKKSMSNLGIEKVFSNVSIQISKLEGEIQKIKKNIPESSDMSVKPEKSSEEAEPESKKFDISGMIDSFVSIIKTPMEEIKKVETGVKEFIGKFGEIKSSISESMDYFSNLRGEISNLMGWFTDLKAAMDFSSPLNVLSYGLFGVSPTVLIVCGAIALLIGVLVYLWNTSEEFRNSITTILEGIGEVLNRIWTEILQPLFSFLFDVFTTVLVPIAEFIGTICCDVIEAIASILESLWTNILGPIANFFVDVFSIALQGLIEIWQAWSPVIQTVFDVLYGIWNTLFVPLVDFVSGAFSGTFETWGETIKAVIDNVKQVFKGIVDFIVGVFTGDWQRALDGVKNICVGIFKGMFELVKSPLNGIIGLINGMIRGLNRIKLPDWVPIIGGKGISIPEIPKLAKGGIVSSATLAIVGEAGKEAVMPLENNTEWITLLAQNISTKLPQNDNKPNNSGIDGNLILQIDSSVIGKVALGEFRKIQRQGGITLIPV